MKKFVLCLALMGTACASRAQYFHGFYGDNTTTGNGQVTRRTSIGHVIAGSQAPYLSVARTDPDGAFTAADNFNNNYELTDAATGRPVIVSNARVIELRSGNGYVVMGSYTLDAVNPNQYGVFYLQLDVSGNPGPLSAYTNPSPDVPITLTALTESASASGEVFAAGVSDNPGGPRHAFAMRLDASGGQNWGYTYDFSFLPQSQQVTISDVLENASTSDLMIVGSGGSDALWLVIDPGNGVPSAADFYDAGRNETFSSIGISRDPAAQGYILSGTTDEYFWSAQNFYRPRMMAVKTDFNRNVQWFNSYVIETHTGNREDGADIVGRMNTLGQYEYYLAGRTYDISSGDENEVVLKIQDDGTVNSGAAGLAVFHFYQNDFNSHPLSIDASDDPISTGFSLYATATDRTTGVPTMLITKAYFNGFTACNSQQGMDAVHVPLNYQHQPGNTGQVDHLPSVNVVLSNQFTSTDNMFCYASGVPQGDNTRMAPGFAVAEQGSALRVYPNPLEKGATLHFSLQSDRAESALLQLVDMTGRIVYRTGFQLQEGQNDLSIEGAVLNLAPGLCEASLQRSSGTEHLKVSIH